MQTRLSALLLTSTLLAATALAQAPTPSVTPVATPSASPSVASAAPAQQGRWLTESGNLEVDLAPCGAAWCGTVTRVLANRSMSGPGAEMVAVDSTPVLGRVLLSGFVPSGDGEWTGQLYNRENGKTYSARMSLPMPDQLQIRAYVGLPLFGKTQVWRRVAVNTQP